MMSSDWNSGNVYAMFPSELPLLGFASSANTCPVIV